MTQPYRTASSHARARDRIPPSPESGRRRELDRTRYSGRQYKTDRCRAAILLLLDLEAEFLVFVQGSQSGFLDRADMNEHIFATGIRRDEPVAFGRVEPFNNALGHRRIAFLPASAAGRVAKRAPW